MIRLKSFDHGRACAFVNALMIAFSLLMYAHPANAQTAVPVDTFLGDESATELANELAEPADELDVCIGWVIEINGVVVSTGSNLGPQSPLFETAITCTNHVKFRVSITETSESSESEDSASIYVTGNFADVPTSSQVKDAADISSGSFLGSNSDEALVRGVLAIPLLIAEKRSSQGQTVEFATPETAAITDTVSGSPGNDTFRTLRGPVLAALVFGGILGALITFLYKKALDQ
jgi:hypothetical protein